MNICLHIPNKSELWFKKFLKEDSKSMDYNAGYNVKFKGYNFDDGTIKTDIKELENVWYKNWINNWPEKYYAYIQLQNSKEFIGEIYAKYFSEDDSYEIGIVILGKFRGLGYSNIAIKLLCNELKKLGAKRLFHELPKSRLSAIKADIHNGFSIVKTGYYGEFLKFGKVEELCRLEKIL